MEILLQKYLRNECTADEAKQVLLFVQTSEGRRLFDQLIEYSESDKVAKVPSDETSERLWQRIYTSSINKTNTRPTDESEPARGRTFPLWSMRLGQVAAVVFPLLVAGWWWLNRTEEISEKTAFGQTRQLTLPDGSVVSLNGNSSLQYQSKWKSSEAREVWLTGEAFFKVTHQSNQQRFLVHTRRNYTIEVLGTEFNVNDRQNATRVLLQSGKIKLTLQQKAVVKSFVMKPGQLVEIDTLVRRVKMNVVKPELFTSWRKRRLVFEGTRFAEIKELLKETYNLNVSVPDERLLEEKVTGTVPSGNVKELLNALAIVLDLKYKQEANQVKFY